MTEDSPKIKQPIFHLILFCGAVFCFVLLWLWPQMNRGFFITDTGYFVYEAQAAFNLFGSPGTYIWLTSYLSGAWLALCPSEAVMYWNALGGSIVCALTYVVAGLIIREVFTVSPVRLFFPLAIAAVFQIHYLFDFAVNYYTLPFLVAEIAILFYLKSRRAVKNWKQILYLLLSAITFSALPALRLPCFGFVFIPVIYELTLAVLEKNFRWKYVLLYTVALSVGLCVMYLLYLTWSGSIPEMAYAKHIKMGHEIDDMLLLAFGTFIRWSLFSIPFVGVVWLVRYGARTKYRWEWLLLIPIAAYSFYIGWRNYICGVLPDPDLSFVLLRFLQKVSPYILLVLAFVPSRYGVLNTVPEDARRQTNTELRLTLLMLTCFGIFYPIGSDMFPLRIINSIPLLLPLLLLVLRDFVGWNKTMYQILTASMLMLAIANLPNNIDTHNTTTKNRLQMTTPFQVRTMAGMYETKEKVEMYEKLIKAIRQYTKPQDEVLFFSQSHELLPAAQVRNWMKCSFFVVSLEESPIKEYMQHKPLPKVAISAKRASSGDYQVSTWEEEFLPLYYRKVYTADCGLTLCEGEKAKYSEFCIWMLKSEQK